MATINNTILVDSDSTDVITWTPLGAADTGVAYQNSTYADKSVQVSGTFTTATLLIEGSIDGSTYAVLTDYSNTSLSFTSAGIKGITENVKYIRPRSSGGDGSTALTVNILASGMPDKRSR